MSRNSRSRIDLPKIQKDVARFQKKRRAIHGQNLFEGQIDITQFRSKVCTIIKDPSVVRLEITGVTTWCFDVFPGAASFIQPCVQHSSWALPEWRGSSKGYRGTWTTCGSNIKYHSMSNAILVLHHSPLWLVHKIRATLPTNEKKNQEQSCLSRTRFPTLGACYVYLLRIVIGSLRCLRLVIGQSNYSSLGFTPLNWTPL